MEYIIIAIIVAAAAGYVGFSLYRRLAGKGGCGCGGNRDSCAARRFCAKGKDDSPGE